MSIKKFKKFIKNSDAVQLINFSLISSLIFVIMLNFVVQFKVESMQDDIENMRVEISSYKDQMALLDVQWAYLTRPARIRELSQKYLNNNGYSLASQIKTSDDLERYYVANYEAEAVQMVASF